MKTLPVVAHRTLAVLDGLDDALVTAVVGPAGSGKTTAVRHWLRTRALPHRWLTITDDDAAADFLHVLSTPESGPIVVDDSHRLPRTPDYQRVLDRGLELGRRFVFLGRTEPQASFWRSVGRGEGVLIGFEDLLLTPADTAAAATARGLDLPDAVLDELYRVTRGWPAPVEIILDVLARAGDPATAGQLPLAEAAQYVRAEAVEPLPDELRTGCAHLAHLGVFSADLVQEALGTDGSEAFDRARRAQMMLVRAEVSPGPGRPADAPGTDALMFPPIVDQVLRRDRTAPGPAEAVLLHRRAARWHEARGEWDRALTHMLQANPADAVRQLGRLISAMEPLGRTEEALQRFRQLPRKLRMQPDSVIGLTLALVQAGLASEARQLLDQTDTAQWTGADQIAELAMTEAMVDRVLVRHATATAAAERALALLDQIPDGSLSAGRLAYLRVMTLEQLREIRLWEGDIPAVRDLMSRMQGDVVRSELQLSLVHSTAVTALAAFDAGDLPLAVEKAQVALRLAERRQFHDTHIVAEAHLVLAGVAAEHDDIEAAAQLLIRTRALAEQGLFPTTVYRVELLLAPLLARLGRAEEAWPVLESLGVAVRRTEDSHLQARILAASALVQLYSGDTAAARTSYRRLHRTTTPPDVLRIRLQLAAALGAPADRTELARCLPEAGEPIDRVLALLLTCHARAHTDPGQAVADLTAALRSAEQLDLWRTVLDLTTGVGPLVAGVRAAADIVHGPSPAYVRRIGAVVLRSSREVSVLSEREIEIAQFLPTRRTNVQIAAELYISENTVKTHVRHIYQKLGVEQRDAAVDRLSELGLIAGDRRN
ncbi:LuxR C-terminal-related transcriptional regulator [Nocardia sp. NBC_00416]|uniref:LuxR C-terminal-related transcriptional regulator n=1 Tax=Nocardia sp. NBC_00416 TaxID=2975991 RepID=UPI002E228939